MDDSRLQKLLFFGELCEGEGKGIKTKEKIKGLWKICQKQFSISVDQCEKRALNRSQRRKLIHEGIENFEHSRDQYAA